MRNSHSKGLTVKCELGTRDTIPQVFLTLRVSSDLENLEMSGKFDARRKSQGISKKTRKVREFCCVKFIFSQSEHPNFENVLGEHVLESWTHKNLIVVWKSQGISSLLESGHFGTLSRRGMK